jgi:hypothetical protein
VSSLRCPRCATVVMAAPGQPPVCPNCGFGAPAPPPAPHHGGWGPPPAQPAYPQPQPYPSYPAYPPAAPYGYAPKKTEGMAIASLVMGCLGWLSFLGLIMDILAIVFGVIALNRIKANPWLGGRGMAIAGIILGSFFLFIVGAAVVFVLVQNLSQPGY